MCPDLVLVNGEDLADYRRVSAAVYSTLCETGTGTASPRRSHWWSHMLTYVKMLLQKCSYLNNTPEPLQMLNNLLSLIYFPLN